MQTTTATVESIAWQDDSVQILRIVGRDYPAVCYKRLAGACSVQSVVRLNITATQMNLGTGGYDFVICKIEPGAGAPADCRMDSLASADTGATQTDAVGKILKLRYTPMQCEVDVMEDERSPLHSKLRDTVDIAGMPVICCGLHSQVPLVAAGIRKLRPEAKIVYCMTDEGSLMLSFSNIARQCVETGLVDTTITCGQAMGGDAEAVSLHSALAGAHAAFGADAVIVAIGPGIAGTSTALGHGGTAQAESVNAAAALGGYPVAVMRASFADARRRHRGVSHHFLTALGRLALARACVCYPGGMPAKLLDTLLAQLDESGVSRKHDLIGVDVGIDGENLPQIDTKGISVTTMGRSFEDDPWFFLTAYAAGVHVGLRIANGGDAR